MDSEILGDRYEMQDAIGRGGMATIYRAVDLRMGRTVAVKILREVYSSDPKFVTRFQREARAASLLQHPNIVQVFDYGQSNESYYIVMEFVDGTDLRRYLKRNGKLSGDRAVKIAHDVSLGLGAAHKRGIVHRDVKPQNIMLNDDDLIKLTDFGIASVYKDAGAERLTTTGMTLGTVQYYAPEQAQGEVVTPAADIYALGIVMYEMLTGRPPFDGDTPVAVAMKHIQEQPEPPSTYNPSIAPGLERIILRCLEKDPRDRFRDGDALAYALENLDRRPAGRPSAAPGRAGAPLSLPSDARPPLPGYGPGARGTPAPRSGPPRGQSPVSGPLGRGAPNGGPRDFDGSRNGPNGGARDYDAPRGGSNGGARDYDATRGGGGYDAPGVFPGISTRPYGPAGGTEPGMPTDRTMPDWLPQRPDEEGGGRRNTMVVGAVVGGVVLLLLLGCALIAPSILSGLGSLGQTATPSPSPIIVQVPRFKGLSLTDAQALAKTSKLTLVQTYATPDPTEANPPAKDQVLDQQPEPGPHTGALTQVTLIISAGPGKTVVPYIVGLDDQTACAKLQVAKLTCALQNYEQSNLPANTVTRTDPPAGTSVDPHTAVSYWLSLGPPTPTPTTVTATATPTPTATATCPPGTPTPGTGHC
jgi:eukaryotic-like serine/threonine-protein kinase